MIDNEPVGYGHLDREGDCVWLGVCIREGDRHKGYGGKICLYLTEYADQIKIPTLFLTVDEENTTGRRLYESKGFKIVEKKGNRLFYARKI